MARCLLHVGLEMELASIVGWFPVWLVSRVVSFPCECVVLALSLIASGVESIVLCYRGKFPVEGALYLRYL